MPSRSRGSRTRWPSRPRSQPSEAPTGGMATAVRGRCRSRAPPVAGDSPFAIRRLMVSDSTSLRLRAVVVDDEPLARDNLRLGLAAMPDVEIVRECGDGQEAIDAIV